MRLPLPFVVKIAATRCVPGKLFFPPTDQWALYDAGYAAFTTIPVSFG